MVPKGVASPLRPGEKAMSRIAACAVWTSNTQCAAVSTWRGEIIVPVHHSSEDAAEPGVDGAVAVSWPAQAVGIGARQTRCRGGA